MRLETPSKEVSVRGLSDLDALVGELVMNEPASIHWADSYSNQRFGSLQEALRAMQDPFFQRFIPEGERAAAVLSEVREFPAYSSKLELAMEVVGRLCSKRETFELKQKDSRWLASFGAQCDGCALTAPVAICLAALAVRGVRVRLQDGAG